jgi:hypothetical protein
MHMFFVNMTGVENTPVNTHKHVVQRMRQHIREDSLTDECLTEILQAVAVLHPKRAKKTYLALCKWSIYYGKHDVVARILPMMNVDHMYNARYHAVYHNKKQLATLISSYIDALHACTS